MSDRFRISLNWVAATIALGLLLTFMWGMYQLSLAADDPPRLADPAPTAAPTPSEGKLPPQYRGPFNPSENLLAMIAIVAPLLTTLVGFFFGKGIGEANANAAISDTKRVNAEIATTLAEKPHATGSTLLAELREAGLVKKK